MKRIQRAGVWSALILLMALVALPVSAQTNLLQDPSFEGPYTGRGRPDLNTPVPWGLWLTDQPRNYDWQNRPDKVFAFPHNADPQRKSGNASQNLNGGYVTFTAALYQTVAVEQGAAVYWQRVGVAQDMQSAAQRLRSIDWG